MKWLNDIRKQPERLRKVLLAFATVIVVLVAGTFWVNKLRQDMFVFLNPDPEDQQAFFEARSELQPRPFAFVGQGWDKLQATIGELFGQTTPSPTPRPPIKGDPHLLPLPESR